MNEHGNNNRNRPISGRRRARCRLQGIALSVLCLFFAACAQTFPDGDVLERYPDGGVPIRLTVSLPQSAFLEKRTKVEKASDETENRIEEMIYGRTTGTLVLTILPLCFFLMDITAVL